MILYFLNDKSGSMLCVGLGSSHQLCYNLQQLFTPVNFSETWSGEDIIYFSIVFFRRKKSI